MNHKKDDNIVRGAAIVSVGTFISKLLGAIYRVPLTNLIGAFGLGLYQTVFPVYALLLDFAGAGVPSALSKLISSSSEEQKSLRAREYLNSSIRLLTVFGIFFSVFLIVSGKFIATLQGNSDAYFAYIALAPSVFLVSVISCFRGYFQGLMNMMPTAISQITEQTVKLFFGLLLSYIFMPNIPLAVAGTTFAITLSELFALVYLALKYKKSKNIDGLKYNFEKVRFKSHAKTILKTVVPITLIGIAIPFSQVIDSFLTVNILSTYRTDATVLYGLLTGVAATVVNLPVSICYGVATVAIPAVASGKKEKDKNARAKKTVALTLIIALPCALIFFIFAPLVIRILFGSLSGMEKSVAINLLHITAPNVIFLSLLQTCNAVLIGKGKLYTPLISMSIGITVKTVLNIILLKIPELNVYGGAIALIACYFFTCLINLILIFKPKVKNESKRACRRQYAS